MGCEWGHLYGYSCWCGLRVAGLGRCGWSIILGRLSMATSQIACCRLDGWSEMVGLYLLAVSFAVSMVIRFDHMCWQSMGHCERSWCTSFGLMCYMCTLASICCCSNMRMRKWHCFAHLADCIPNMILEGLNGLHRRFLAGVKLLLVLKIVVLR